MRPLFPPSPRVTEPPKAHVTPLTTRRQSVASVSSDTESRNESSITSSTTDTPTHRRNNAKPNNKMSGFPGQPIRSKAGTMAVMINCAKARAKRLELSIARQQKLKLADRSDTTSRSSPTKGRMRNHPRSGENMDGNLEDTNLENGFAST